jgi:hypothetical protein
VPESLDKRIGQVLRIVHGDYSIILLEILIELVIIVGDDLPSR